MHTTCLLCLCLTSVCPPTVFSVLPLSLKTDDAAPLNSSRCIDVRDFGAKGDGTTDDSDAIQAAVQAAIASEKDFPVTSPPVGSKPGVRQHNLVGGPDLCFSPGDYRITRTIELSPVQAGNPDANGIRPTVRLPAAAAFSITGRPFTSFSHRIPRDSVGIAEAKRLVAA